MPLGRHYRVLNLLGCISAGVFLGAGLMHMTAEALEGIESEIQKLVVQVGSRGTGCPEAGEDSGKAAERPVGGAAAGGRWSAWLLEGQDRVSAA